MGDQAERLRQMIGNSSAAAKRPVVKARSDSSTRVIAVTSGKGGVGKTNFTVNLALALAGLSKKVLILDADLGTANVDVVLGYSSKSSILNLLEDGITAEEIVTEGPRGIRFISGGSGIYRLANLHGDQLQSLVSKISIFDDWADIILVDTGAGLSQNVLNFVTAADEVIIVATPEPTSITDAYALMKVYAGNQGQAPLKLVVNRVAEAAEGQLVADKLIKVTLRFLNLTLDNLGFIYEDVNLVKAVKKQVPLLLSFPDTTAARCIEQIASRLVHTENIVVRTGGIRGFLRRFLEMVR
jgi:flagellar biosynthesis protein FlhG